jgi:hypothetical protein
MMVSASSGSHLHLPRAKQFRERSADRNAASASVWQTEGHRLWRKRTSAEVVYRQEEGAVSNGGMA